MKAKPSLGCKELHERENEKRQTSNIYVSMAVKKSSHERTSNLSMMW